MATFRYKGMSLERETGRLDLVSVGSFCSDKDGVRRARRHVTDWETVSAKDTPVTQNERTAVQTM